MWGWEEKVLLKQMKDYFENTTREQFFKLLKEVDCLHLIEDGDVSDKPYIEGFEVRGIIKYNPAYGDDRICECGDPYYRHFDTYEDMSPTGCKYCHCSTFVERTESSIVGKKAYKKTGMFRGLVGTVERSYGGITDYMLDIKDVARTGFNTHDDIVIVDDEK